MAFIICKHHGGHVATFLCSHLRDAAYRREPLPEIFYVQACISMCQLGRTTCARRVPAKMASPKIPRSGEMMNP